MLKTQEGLPFFGFKMLSNLQRPENGFENAQSILTDIFINKELLSYLRKWLELGPKLACRKLYTRSNKLDTSTDAKAFEDLGLHNLISWMIL